MKTTQNFAILQYLKTGGRLTPLDALQRFGCARLAARINDLKSEGYNIHSEMVDVHRADGSTARVARYSIPGAREREQLNLFAGGVR